MATKIRWGIMGTGYIADKFAGDLPLTKDGELTAVGSRSKAKAQKFAKQHNAVRAYGSYEELAADPDVDIVYVATPHPFHMDNALLAIKRGKHVLCEKPISMNAKQTRRMIASARKQGVFLMEAMWTRFFPAVIQVRNKLTSGAIGKVLAIEADFGIHFKVGPKHRIFNPVLGGGALLDLGIYPVSFASMVFGVQPKKIVSVVRKTKDGIDKHAVIAFEYSDGATAAVSTSSIVQMKNEVRIFGSKGMITVHDLFISPGRFTLAVTGKNPKSNDFPYDGHGMHFEADHVHRCLQKNQFQSDILSLDESLNVMQTMDTIRRHWKLRYVNE